MTGKEEWFDELLQNPPDHREKKLATLFLETTIEAVNARYPRSALRTAADFDRFKKEAYEHDKPFYIKLFTILSTLIKDYHLDHRDNDDLEQTTATTDEEDSLSTKEAVEKALGKDP